MPTEPWVLACFALVVFGSFVVGTVAGFGTVVLVQGAYGSGGPMVVFVASREPHDKHSFRATLNALWLGSSLVLVPRLLVERSLHGGTLRMALAMLPPMVAGIALGNRLHAALDARRFRQVVAWTLVAAALPLTLSALRGMAPGSDRRSGWRQRTSSQVWATSSGP
jgi:uncharacterized membrane protein YfcA